VIKINLRPGELLELFFRTIAKPRILPVIIRRQIMRQITYIILAIFILAGCSNDRPSADNNVNQAERLKQNLIPIFKGVWVLTDYIDAINQTKSPLRSADKLQAVVTMVFDGTLQSDSVKLLRV